MTTPASSPVAQTFLTGTTPDGLAYAVRGQGPPLLLLSGLLWSLAFATFAIRLWPALLQPRADGRPG